MPRILIIWVSPLVLMTRCAEGGVGGVTSIVHGHGSWWAHEIHFLQPSGLTIKDKIGSGKSCDLLISYRWSAVAPGWQSPRHLSPF